MAGEGPQGREGSRPPWRVASTAAPLRTQSGRFLSLHSVPACLPAEALLDGAGLQAGKGRPCDCVSSSHAGSGEKNKAGAEEGLSAKDGQRCSDEMAGKGAGLGGEMLGVRASRAPEDFTSLGSPGGAAGDAGLRGVGLRGKRETEGSGVLGLDWGQRLDTGPHVVGKAGRS